MVPEPQTAPRTGMTWEEVCADPNLQDLPYKIELNEWGQIIMSPTRLKHGRYQAQIAAILNSLIGQEGKVVTECAIKTGKGTRVADVAWFSSERWDQVKDEFDSSVAPEICVEVLSPRNASGEIALKRQLYFDAGAREVWICDDQGKLQFYQPGSHIQRSALVPAFPDRIDV